jgi:hypothetical protein
LLQQASPSPSLPMTAHDREGLGVHSFSPSAQHFFVTGFTPVLGGQHTNAKFLVPTARVLLGQHRASPYEPKGTTMSSGVQHCSELSVTVVPAGQQIASRLPLDSQTFLTRVLLAGQQTPSLFTPVVPGGQQTSSPVLFMNATIWPGSQHSYFELTAVTLAPQHESPSPSLPITAHEEEGFGVHSIWPSEQHRFVTGLTPVLGGQHSANPALKSNATAMVFLGQQKSTPKIKLGTRMSSGLQHSTSKSTTENPTSAVPAGQHTPGWPA